MRNSLPQEPAAPFLTVQPAGVSGDRAGRHHRRSLHRLHVLCRRVPGRRHPGIQRAQTRRRPRMHSGRVLIKGNKTVSCAAAAAGRKRFSGYPAAPRGRIAEDAFREPACKQRQLCPEAEPGVGAAGMIALRASLKAAACLPSETVIAALDCMLPVHYRHLISSKAAALHAGCAFSTCADCRGAQRYAARRQRAAPASPQAQPPRYRMVLRPHPPALLSEYHAINTRGKKDIFKKEHPPSPGCRHRHKIDPARP